MVIKTPRKLLTSELNWQRRRSLAGSPSIRFLAHSLLGPSPRLFLMTPLCRLSQSRSFYCFLLAVSACSLSQAQSKPKIAIFSGPTATIQNNKPLITSNKAREQYGLPLLKDAAGKPLMDWPRYQRIAAPVTVYIEMFTGHPLESQVSELYAAPDGYVHAKGEFS